MHIRCGLLTACLSLLLALTLATPAASEDRKMLVLRGRVTDAQGAPIAGARISAHGTRRANATCDDAGQFEIRLPLGKPGDLVRNPIAVRVRAERRGWRIALPEGGAEMGLELRIVPGGDSLALCEVRSNHPPIASTIGRVLGIEGDVTGMEIVNFVGTPGEEIAHPETLDLPVVDRIAIPGLRPPPAAPAPKPAAPVTVEKKKKSEAAVASERVEAKPAKPGKLPKKPKREPERRDPPAAIVPTTPSPSLPPPPSREAERALAEAKLRAERERSAAREAARRDREEAQKRDRLQRRSLPDEKARTIEAEATRGAAEEELKHVREAQEKRWGAMRREVHKVAGSADTTSPPTVRALDGLAGAPARPEPRARDFPVPRLTAARDTVKVRPPQPLPAPPAAPVRAPAGASAKAPATSTPALAPPKAPAPSAPSPSRPPTSAPATSTSRPPTSAPATSTSRPSTSAPATSTSRPSTPTRAPAASRPSTPASPPAATRPTTPESEHITAIPQPESGPRARARPLVIRTGPPPGITDTRPPTGDSCSCRIEGTVEVDSDRPLPDRTPVAVSLVWYPAIADTVELFMGSPRRFELPAAPCGPQRLKVINLGRTHFDVTSRQAMAGFRCERGALYQFRLVLRPR